MSHGTTHAYNKGCRCDKCKSAKSEANRLMRSKLPPKTGIRGRKKGFIVKKIEKVDPLKNLDNASEEEIMNFWFNS